MGAVTHKGSIQADVVVVGDSPSQEEFENRQAFSGRLGEVVEDILYHSGIHPDNVLFVNCVSYRKFNRTQFSAAEISKDAAENLIPIINEHPRKLVIVLGNNALYATGVSNTQSGVNTLRGRLLRSPYFDAPVVASIHPFFVLQKPDEVDDFYSDIKYACRIYRGDFKEQTPINIIDLETVSGVESMYKQTVSDYPYLGYDFETTDVDRDTADAVSLAFANGSKDEFDRDNAYFWGGYDKLRPRFEDYILKQFKEAFDWLFQEAGKSYALIGYNMGFDDWIAERWVGHELPGCTYDAMLMKWCINNKGRHGLKEATARYLGYPDYEAGAYEYFKEVKARRGKILRTEEDLKLLRDNGIEPELSKTGQPKWPKSVDKGWCGYALIPYDILREYNAYDAVYTRKLFDVFYSKIKKEGLGTSYKLRHSIARELMRCEQRGFLLDQELNKKYSKELEEIDSSCRKQIEVLAKEIKPDMEDFNPSSGQQLAKLLFGDPEQVPVINRDLFYQTDNRKIIKQLNQEFDSFERSFYGTFTKVKAALKEGAFDYNHCADKLAAEFLRVFPRYQTVTEYNERGEETGRVRTHPSMVTKPKNIYPYGLYEPKVFTKGGTPSTAGAVLQSLYQEKEHDLLTLVLMQRKASKLKGTFVDAIYNLMDRNGIVHPRMNVIGTETGRISSSKPNAQNFPKYMRGQFVPRPGYTFVEFDLSQAEVRAIAAFANDDKLMKALYSADIHRAVASEIFGKKPEDITAEERRYAKTIVFGIIYGMGADSLSVAINVTKEKAQEYIDLFFEKYPKTKAWLDAQVELAATAPYYVYTPWGTRRSTKGMLSIDNGIRGDTARQAMNTPIQGAAGELTLYYIVEIMSIIRSKDWDIWLVNTTHDSVTLEVPIELAWKIDEKFTRNDKEIKKSNLTVVQLEKLEKLETAYLNHENLSDEDYEFLHKHSEYTYTPAGPVVEVIKKVIDTPVPIKPLDKVKFKADIEINNYWSARPNLKKALDPKEDTFRWELIKADEILTAAEKEELIDSGLLK